jgi:serine protease Do
MKSSMLGGTMPWAGLPAALLLGALLATALQDGAGPVKRGDKAPPARPKELPAFEAKIQAVYERVSPSTVIILFGPERQHKGSGVVIDPEGLILTHGHHLLEPGTPVTVAFKDARKVPGKFLGVNHYYDQSLIRLEGAGPWPAVPLGKPAELQHGEACLLLGYPAIYYRDGRPPLVRLGRVLGFFNHQIMTSCRPNGGDSGGPLFNLKGELLGTHQMQPMKQSHGAGHPSVDCYRQIRDRLLAGELVKEAAMEGPFEDPAGLAGMATPCHRSVVEVLVRDKPVALGLVVDSDGWIVTKASEMTEDRVLCRLGDGRKLEGTVERRMKVHDLALLKVKGDGLVAGSWASGEEPKAGKVVASVGLEPRPLGLGVVCSPVFEVPRERGQLTINLEPAEPGVAGLRITEVWAHREAVARVLRAGDVVTHINGDPTPDVATFVRVRERHLDDPAAVVGDTLRLTLLRDGKVVQVNVPIESSSANRIEDFRGRLTGFPAVFTHDGTVPRNQLGGPVVDADGKVIALNIGTVWGSYAYAIPGHVVRKAIDGMRDPKAPANR